MACKLCLKDDIVGLVLRPSSRLFHILLADGILELVGTFVPVNGAEKNIIFLRGHPEISLTKEELSSEIYVGTIPLLILCIKYNLLVFLTDRLVHLRDLKTSEPTCALESMLRTNRIIFFGVT